MQIALQCPAEPVLVQAVRNKAALKMAVVGIGEIVLQKMKIITQTGSNHAPSRSRRASVPPGSRPPFCGGVVFMSGNIGVQKHVRHNAAQLQCQAVQTPRPVSHQMSGQQPVAFFIHRKKHLLIKMKHSDLYRKRGGKNRICPLEYRERVWNCNGFFCKECKIFKQKGAKQFAPFLNRYLSG